MHFRAYYDKTKGGDHSRIVDFELADVSPRPIPPGTLVTTEIVAGVYPEAKAAADEARKRGETLSELVVLKPSPPDSDGAPVG